MDFPIQTSPGATANVACLNCREKHLKCDGNPDGCGRCRTSSLFCHFIPSRRGRRGQPGDYLVLDTRYAPSIDDLDIFTEAQMPLPASNDLSSMPPTQPTQGDTPMNLHLVRVFYEFFHPAHPVLPPIDLWISSSPPGYLIQVVEIIGLHYLSPGQAPECSADLWTSIREVLPSLEKAQACLLLSVLLHARGEPENAKLCVGLAIQCAIGLGMHRREISDAIEVQNPSRAESMRRTLWEIFVVDTLMAAVQVGGTLEFRLATPEVPLPSEDAKFQDWGCEIPLIFAKDLARHAFLETGKMSSLAYRVEATLILRQCLIACETNACNEPTDILDSLISAWFHRWPQEKSSILQPDGRVNQIDFQAAMIIHCASIYLHFPRSTLVCYLPKTREIFCSRPPSLPVPAPGSQMHTAKIINAAVELSKLSSLSTYVTGHSPFFACTLVLSSIVQVTVLSTQTGEESGKYYSYLALNIGVLKSMGTIWEIAACSMRKLSEITREVTRAFYMEASSEMVGPILTPRAVLD